MSVFENVGQRLRSMNYTWRSPATYIVFVPGLSLLVQRIQMAAIAPLIDQSNPTPERTEEAMPADSAARKFINISKWHLRGSLLQTLGFIALALKTEKLAFPLLAIGILGIIELFSTAYKACTNRVYIYEFDSKGEVETRKPASFYHFLSLKSVYAC